jgi:hypothetical protein
LPAVALKAMLPVASGAFKSEPHGEPEQPADAASRIRRYWPGASETAGRFVVCQVAPVAVEY